MIRNFQIKILILNSTIINLFISSLLVSIRLIELPSRSNKLLLIIICNNKLLFIFLNRVINLLFIIRKTLIRKSLQRIRMFIFFGEFCYKVNRILERILSLKIIKLVLIIHSLFFKTIINWLLNKRIIILIINIFRMSTNFVIIHPNWESLFICFCINSSLLRLNNRHTRLRLDIVFKYMIKSIINNWAIRNIMFAIIALSQFMKSVQSFLFLLVHPLFGSLFFWGTSSCFPLPIIPKVLIKVICVVYLLLKKLLRNTYRSGFMFKLWILSFMNF